MTQPPAKTEIVFTGKAMLCFGTITIQKIERDTES
jgi:hypothetical protein